MKLSYDWLKKYIDVDKSAGEIAEALTMSGSEVGEVEESGEDIVMDLEITTNRPDCLNVIGLAREVSAVFDKDIIMPDEGLLNALVSGEVKDVECDVRSKDLCPLYTARVISGVNVKPASEEIIRHITSVGIRSVNNIVDITNFCLMENGQPLHAFDLDKVKGRKIIVREAVKGEKIVTIDDVERELAEGMLVIADEERPIAVAGVMGGKDTEITDDTENILLESAYFDPLSVRRTARSLGISTDSSYRFERGVDKGFIEKASDRAAFLINKEAGGDIGSIVPAGNIEASGKAIDLDIKRAEKVLGISLETEKVKNILVRLGLEISGEEGAELSLLVPTFREDLRSEIDLIEDIARITGYGNIPADVTKIIPQVVRKSHARKGKEKLTCTLSSMGLSEIMSYSLISETAAERFPDLVENPVVLRNPLSSEHKVMTPHLLDGMLKAVSWNINRKNKDLGLFETGKIYYREGKGRYSEFPVLCIGLTGLLSKNWRDGQRAVDFYDLKGVIENFSEALNVPIYFSEGKKISGITQAASVFTEAGEAIGFAGKVSAGTAKEYDISEDVYIAQIRLEVVFEKAVLTPRYHAIPKFPTSLRDMSILCDNSLPAEEIEKIITSSGGDLIRNKELLDVYEGKQIPEGKRSLTYSIEYGDPDRTLTEDEIEKVHSAIKEALVKKLSVTFR